MCDDYDIEDFDGGFYCPYLGYWCYSLSCIECEHYIIFNKYYDELSKGSDENA